MQLAESNANKSYFSKNKSDAKNRFPLRFFCEKCSRQISEIKIGLCNLDMNYN